MAITQKKSFYDTAAKCFLVGCPKANHHPQFSLLLFHLLARLLLVRIYIHIYSVYVCLCPTLLMANLSD